jgi:peptide/nickel transport system substrate-binding protein
MPAHATHLAAASTLTVDMAADPVGLDPEAVEDNSSGFVMSTVYDELVEYKPGTTDVGPGLATSWTITNGGKTYTFNLRHGVTFQDGTPYNARAQVKVFDRLLNPKNPNYVMKEPNVQSFVPFTFGDPSFIKSYRATGPYTFQVQLTQPFAPFLASLAMVWSAVVSPAAVTKYGWKGILNHPVGTGPYSFVSWQKGNKVVLKANPSYWGTKPKVQNLIFQVVPEGATRVLQVEQGQAQIDADVTTQDYLSVAHSSKVKIYTQPGETINGVGMTVNVKPFNNVLVRRAVNYAVNRSQFSAGLFKGLATPMNSFLPPPIWSWSRSIRGYPYSPSTAKALLRKAGYPNGFSTTLLAYTNPRGYDPNPQGLALAVQQELGQIGVKVTIRNIDFTSFLNTVRNPKNKGMYLDGWSGDNGDPDDFLYEMFATAMIPVGNTNHLRDAQLDSLLNRARHAQSKATRVRLYVQAQQRLNADAPWIMGAYVTQVRLASPNVHGFQLNPAQMFFGMQNVSLS